MKCSYIVEEQTFINTFESSPVHCLNLRPCLKRRSCGKAGVAAILWHMLDVLAEFGVVNYVPSVDLIQDVICFSLAVCVVQVLANPGNKVILKSSLDKLM